MRLDDGEVLVQVGRDVAHGARDVLLILADWCDVTAYSGTATNLPHEVLQRFLEDVAAGAIQLPIGHVYAFEEIVAAHRAMEEGTAGGKLVVTT